MLSSRVTARCLRDQKRLARGIALVTSLACIPLKVIKSDRRITVRETSA